MPPDNKETESVLSVLENLNKYFKLNREHLNDKYNKLSIVDHEG